MSNYDKTTYLVLAIVLAFAILWGMAVGYMLGTPDDLPLVAPFTDTVGHPYAWAIEEIRLAGLTAGCQTEPAMYCPDRPLTRGEAAVMLARLLEK